MHFVLNSLRSSVEAWHCGQEGGGKAHGTYIFGQVVSPFRFHFFVDQKKAAQPNSYKAKVRNVVSHLHSAATHVLGAVQVTTDLQIWLREHVIVCMCISDTQILPHTLITIYI